MQNCSIVLIDDDPRAHELVSATLAGGDFEVLAAADGLTGIELARTAKPAVIILDMMMPEMDGISTLQRLNRDPDLKDIPVIAITASIDVKYTEKAFRAGAKFFLPKPFRPATLLRTVELAVDSVRRETPIHRRRRHPRHPADVPVRCLIRDGNNVPSDVQGHTANISLGGLLLLLPKTVTPGTNVQIGLGLPEGSITAKGTVVWQNTQPVDGERFPHGVQLHGFTEEGALSHYRRYIGQLSALAAP